MRIHIYYITASGNVLIERVIIHVPRQEASSNPCLFFDKDSKLNLRCNHHINYSLMSCVVLVSKFLMENALLPISFSKKKSPPLDKNIRIRAYLVVLISTSIDMY
jgi:hypothetical protein